MCCSVYTYTTLAASHRSHVLQRVAALYKRFSCPPSHIACVAACCSVYIYASAYTPLLLPRTCSSVLQRVHICHSSSLSHVTHVAVCCRVDTCATLAPSHVSHVLQRVAACCSVYIYSSLALSRSRARTSPLLLVALCVQECQTSWYMSYIKHRAWQWLLCVDVLGEFGWVVACVYLVKRVVNGLCVHGTCGVKLSTVTYLYI